MKKFNWINDALDSVISAVLSIPVMYWIMPTEFITGGGFIISGVILITILIIYVLTGFRIKPPKLSFKKKKPVEDEDLVEIRTPTGPENFNRDFFVPVNLDFQQLYPEVQRTLNINPENLIMSIDYIPNDHLITRNIIIRSPKTYNEWKTTKDKLKKYDLDLDAFDVSFQRHIENVMGRHDINTPQNNLQRLRLSQELLRNATDF